MDFLELAVRVVTYFVPFLFALCFHEFAHGFVAKMRGDRTAELMGRLTLNPIAHMDLIGTLILPLLAIFFNSPIFFGWAKPVPVNPRNLKNERTDMFWVALAGPLSNVFLSIVGAIVLGLSVKYFIHLSIIRGVVELLKTFIVVNLFLAIFNMIPIHPLDGGKVLARFLPYHINRKMEEHEGTLSMVLMILIMSGALKILSIPVMWAYGLLTKLALGL